MTTQRTPGQQSTRLDEHRADPSRHDRDTDRHADRDDGRGRKPDEPNPLLREGADAPDAADIESPEEQR